MLLLLLAACPQPAEDEEDEASWWLDDHDDDGDDTASDEGDSWGEDSDDDDGCDNEVDETVPRDGAVDAYYRGVIEFHLDDPDPTAVIQTTIPGTQSFSDDGDSVYWTPSVPLEPSTTYTVTLSYCAGDPEISFTTSALGEPVDPSHLVGRTYALDLEGARIIEPDGIGSVLTSQLTQQILVGVVAADATALRMIQATAMEGSPDEQDYCSAASLFPDADFTQQPFFQIGPEDTTLSVAGYEIDFGELEITGSFAADGSYFGGGTLSGLLDTRPLAPLLDDRGDEGAICDLAINFGARCGPCPSDGEPYCLTLVADQITAVEVEDLVLAEIAGTDCDSCDTWSATTVPLLEEQVCP